MRIIFMGSPDFAVPSLEALVEAGHDVVAAYASRPARPGGARPSARPPCKSGPRHWGSKSGRRGPCATKTSRRGSAALDADLAVVAAYGLILPKPILEAPKAGCINVHASLLPRWRGAAPIQRAILAGDETTGVTIMRMDEGLDTGPMLLKRELDLRGKNAGQVTEELAKLGADALIEWLEHPTAPEPQPDDGVTYASKIDKAEARIDWSKAADEIERQVRAFNPVPGAWFEADGERIKLLEAAIGGDALGSAGRGAR